MKTLFILDERWNSALTNLGLTIARLYNGEKACAVLKGFSADKICKDIGIDRFFIEDPRASFFYFAFKSTKSVIERFKPEQVVVIRGDELLFCSILKRIYGFRLIRIHGEAKGIRDNVFNRFLHRNYVDKVVVSSKKLMCPILRGKPLLVVNGIVDSNKFSFSPSKREKTRKTLGLSEKDVLFGMIGRLDQVKGHEVFIKALSILKQKDIRAKAVILGEEKGTKVSYLKGLANKLKLLDFIKFITERRDDIVSIISAIDVGVVPSIGSEIIARVPLEFMSCERPIVVADVGVLPELVEPSFGIVAKPNPEDLADAMERILRNDFKLMGKIAREVVLERYSYSVIGNRINEFLR